MVTALIPCKRLPSLSVDVTDVALEWAERNVINNPHISELIEMRRVDIGKKIFDGEGLHADQVRDGGDTLDLGDMGVAEIGPSCLSSVELQSGVQKTYETSPILLGVVKDEEKFDFCMCNPPFFETMEEAGMNPKTACGGTKEEMVCPGGELAFITRIIEDSVQLKQSFRCIDVQNTVRFIVRVPAFSCEIFPFYLHDSLTSFLIVRWYTSMVGRKSNLKILTSKLHEVGVTVVKTTEFVQGHTSRWGLAWSFVPPSRKIVSSHVTEKNNPSFMLEVQYSILPSTLIIHVFTFVFSFFFLLLRYDQIETFCGCVIPSSFIIHLWVLPTMNLDNYYFSR